MEKCKRLKKKQRLINAKTWIPKYDGKNLVKGYRKHYAVSLLGAVSELKLLGYEFSEEYVNNLKKAEQNRIEQRRKKKMEQQEALAYNSDSDSYFYYIAGYTDNGFPFGITWEQAEEQGLESRQDQKKKQTSIIDDDDLPF